MVNRRTIIWLDDNPSLIPNNEQNIIIESGYFLQVWDGNFNRISERRGLQCLKHFKKSIERFVNDTENLAGIILDYRIPVNDLFILGMPDVRTRGGLFTGLKIGQLYLRNFNNDSPLGNSFRNTPLLFYTCGSLYGYENLWHDPKCKFLQKDLDSQVFLKQWCDSLDV